MSSLQPHRQCPCRGPNFGMLANGQTVKAADGTEVRPEQCMEDGIKGECVAVIDCPSEAYLPALVAALPDIVAAMDDSAKQRTTLVFHLAPGPVQQAAAYQEVLSSLAHCMHFGPEGRFDPAQHAPALANAVSLQVRRRPHTMHGLNAYQDTRFCLVPALSARPCRAAMRRG